MSDIIKFGAAALCVAGSLVATPALAGDGGYGYGGYDYGPKIKEVSVNTYGDLEARIKIRGGSYGEVKVVAYGRIVEKCRTRGNDKVVEPHTTIYKSVKFEGKDKYGKYDGKGGYGYGYDIGYDDLDLDYFGYDDYEEYGGGGYDGGYGGYGGYDGGKRGGYGGYGGYDGGKRGGYGDSYTSAHVDLYPEDHYYDFYYHGSNCPPGLNSEVYVDIDHAEVWLYEKYSYKSSSDYAVCWSKDKGYTNELFCKDY